MPLASRSLALFAALLLALPQGWCCYVGVGHCCQAAKPTEQSEEAPPARSCCCPEKTEQEPIDPTPPARPDEPAKACCCEKQPTAAPETKRLPPVPELAALTVPVSPPVVTLGEAVPQDGMTAASLPQLHVLHCVWLC